MEGGATPKDETSKLQMLTTHGQKGFGNHLPIQ